MTNSKQKVLSDDWPEASRFRKSIRLEFSLYISAMVLIMMVATGLVVTNQYVDTVTENVIETLLVQARSYSGPAGKHIISSETPDALLLNNICTRLAGDNPDVYWSGIAGTDGRFLAHTDIKRVIAGAELPQVTGPNQSALLRQGENIDLVSDTIFTVVPIVENGIELGRLAIASSADQIAQARNQSIVAVASISALMLLIGLPCTMLVLHRKLRPVSVITDTLRRVDFEDLEFNIPLKSRNEFGYLAQTIEVMGTKLGAAQRHLLEKDRIARELEIAREIQAKILPREYPKTAAYEFAGVYRSAKEIGGDYYDFIPVDDNRLAVLVADVSGKSLPGMLVMLLTRDIVRQNTRLMPRPADLLCRVNRELRSDIKKGMFVTMFFGLLDRSTGVLDFASAGHNPLIRMDATGRTAELVKTRGFPLGLMPDELFEKRIEASRIELNAGDWIIQYTDGMNEAQSAAGEEFGMERFVDLLKSSGHRSPAELIDETVAQHQAFVGTAEQYDDITLMAMKWQGTGVQDERVNAREATHAG